jgi:hypothetical protein
MIVGFKSLHLYFTKGKPILKSGYAFVDKDKDSHWTGGKLHFKCDKKGHTIPVKGCSCGIYFTESLEALHKHNYMTQNIIVQLALSGTILKGELASRASDAEIMAIYPKHCELCFEPAVNIINYDPGKTDENRSYRALTFFRCDKHTPDLKKSKSLAKKIKVLTFEELANSLGVEVAWPVLSVIQEVLDGHKINLYKQAVASMEKELAQISKRLEKAIASKRKVHPLATGASGIPPRKDKMLEVIQRNEEQIEAEKARKSGLKSWQYSKHKYYAWNIPSLRDNQKQSVIILKGNLIALGFTEEDARKGALYALGRNYGMNKYYDYDSVIQNPKYAAQAALEIAKGKKTFLEWEDKFTGVWERLVGNA